MVQKYKITTIVGTRPEIIRLATLIKRFDQVFDHRLIHTGQNSNPNLSDVFFRDLELRGPDTYLNLGGKSLGDFLGTLLMAAEQELSNNRPDAIVILGDTNSSLSALIAKRMQIPIYHLEAGNRSFDSNVPEEINRRVIDHLSDFNLAYSSHAQRNLIAEGLHPRMTSVIGSPLVEVLDSIASKVAKSDVLERLKLTSGGYFLASAHRQENIDSAGRQQLLIECLNEVAKEFGLPILVSAHPRTEDKLAQQKHLLSPLVKLHEPFGFIDYVALQKHAKVVLSDSGSISEESAILGFPAVTLRDSMERPEALETGAILMAGLDSKNVIQAISTLMDFKGSFTLPEEYKIKNTSERVTNYILSTIGRHKFWTGIRTEL